MADRSDGADPERTRANDPTLVTNQPSLRTSAGRVWIVWGTLFTVVALVLLCLVAFVVRGPSMPTAIVTAVIVAIAWVGMLVARFAVPSGRLRLGLLAALMITIAIVAVVGLLLCAAIEWQEAAAVSAG